MDDLKSKETELIEVGKMALVVIDLQNGIVQREHAPHGIGVDTTAREAYQRGYHQIFVEDAMTASTKEEHDYVCRSIFPRIGQIRTCEDILNNFALSSEGHRDTFETRRR